VWNVIRAITVRPFRISRFEREGLVAHEIDRIRGQQTCRTSASQLAQDLELLDRRIVRVPEFVNTAAVAAAVGATAANE
jgi:hypothetical protein